MAGNYITIGSKFKPFSYAEMLQPVAMATEAHKQVEEQYANLSTQASQWEEKANEQTDPYAYKMYKTYADDLNKQANILAKEGLTPVSRKSMFDKARIKTSGSPTVIGGIKPQYSPKNINDTTNDNFGLDASLLRYAPVVCIS